MSLSLPPPTEMFHFGGSRPARRHAARWADIDRPGLPHSDTPGSKRARRSPGLIAACRVLPRPLAPRHPSCARIVARPRGSKSISPGGGPSGPFHGPAISLSHFASLLSFPLLLPDCQRTRAPPRAGAPRLRGAPAGGRIQDRRTAPRLGLTGLEPVTPRLSSACSKPAELQAPRPNWRQPGSNRRPPACKAGALPLSYAPFCSGADRPPRRVFQKGCAARALPRVSLGRAPRGDPAWGPRGHRPVGGGRRAGAPAFSLERR